jgi:hypothetical protein
MKDANPTIKNSCICLIDQAVDDLNKNAKIRP